jgi:hypothetical protein
VDTFHRVGKDLELNLGGWSQWEQRLENSQVSGDLQNLS